MPVDLLSAPRFQSQDLGLPLPDDPHAVSACLPLWAHNIGYEEGDPAVISKLQAAYPRFCFHPTVQQLNEQILRDRQMCGLPFASRKAASRAIEYVQHAAGADTEIQITPLANQAAGGATGVSVHADVFSILKQYWQHAGENASSRVCELILNETPATCSDTEDRRIVRNRVAAIQQTDVENVFLFPSGMAAIAATWRTVQQGWQGSTCQFGFPYVDTLKIQQRFPGAQHTFFPIGNDDDLASLRQQCSTAPPTAVYCEVPTNPLLVTPNLLQLRQLADEYGFLLIVDDTLAACGNLEVLRVADVAVTSLTKYFSGYGNVLAGCMTLNPAGRHFERLHQLIAEDFEETLADVDVSVVRHNSEDIAQRMKTINSNAAELADLLQNDDRVEHVYYPSSASAEYESLRAANGGYGGLLSIVLKSPADTTPQVFDALEVCKGPNLGTNFTLCCPYTILAHYTELDFAEQCGVSRWLLRISVGTEPVEELKRRFLSAFATASSDSQELLR